LQPEKKKKFVCFSDGAKAKLTIRRRNRKTRNKSGILFRSTERPTDRHPQNGSRIYRRLGPDADLGRGHVRRSQASRQSRHRRGLRHEGGRRQEQLRPEGIHPERDLRSQTSQTSGNFYSGFF